MTSLNHAPDVYLVIGSGARAHALAWALGRPSSEGRLPIVHVAPGNPGIVQDPDVLGECHPVHVTDMNGMLSLAKQLDTTLTVVGPEVPLGSGIVDAFNQEGLLIWGPTAFAARLECSKRFAKEVMHRAHVPTAPWEAFDSVDDAIAHVHERSHPVMIKASGLAGGKGSFRSDSIEQSEALLEDLMVHQVLGEAGLEVVIEDVLLGEEVSYIVATDGVRVWPFNISRDHKRLLDCDEGPNTGGMGATTNALLHDDALHDFVMQRVILPTLEHMRHVGTPYQGFLYAGLMIEEGDVQVLEFNVRLGDPEAQALLFALQPEGLGRTLIEMLRGGDVPYNALRSQASGACVVLATDGYPSAPKPQALGHQLHTLSVCTEAKVFYASVKAPQVHLCNGPGRVLSVTARAPVLKEALAQCRGMAERISWPGAHWRRDIGHRESSNVTLSRVRALLEERGE